METVVIMAVNLKKHVPLIKFLGPRHLLKSKTNAVELKILISVLVTEQSGTLSTIINAVNRDRAQTLTRNSSSSGGSTSSGFKLKKIPLSENEIEIVMVNSNFMINCGLLF